MSYLKTRSIFAAIVLAFASPLLAGDDPRHERHELMEGVGDAAKPIGQMLKGEREFDADVVMASLETFDKAAAQFGELFPPGSETGEDTEAAPAIWEDRAGFEKALATWSDAVDAAIAANPQTVEETKSVAGPIFNACKACHDDYRIEDE
ncbi:MAG: cytochrome c [Gammaproteobacteria bacterium]|jgi:cytochrome c556|nr:cytochrome c [Gammaproteobacteria bacterium]